MASKVLNRCSGVSALNNARSSDSLPHANTGPGLLIGAFHCEAVMLSPAEPDGERYQVRRCLLRYFVTVDGWPWPDKRIEDVSLLRSKTRCGTAATVRHKKD